jgi:S1-C subfamily serine protease
MKSLLSALRSVLLASSVAALVVACSSTPQSQTPSKPEIASHLKSMTVGLVEDDPFDGVHAFCTGVWVSDTAILTAHHCVSDHPVGGRVLYVVEGDVFPPGTHQPRAQILPRVAVVSAVDDDHDLALLRVDTVPVGHGIAGVAAGEPVSGQTGHQVGQPLGLWWSYSSGDISAIQYVDTTGDGQSELWVQTTTPASPGNSGGGLFNDGAELIGICHATLRRGQNVNIYIHPDYIRAFLARA